MKKYQRRLSGCSLSHLKIAPYRRVIAHIERVLVAHYPELHRLDLPAEDDMVKRLRIVVGCLRAMVLAVRASDRVVVIRALFGSLNRVLLRQLPTRRLEIIERRKAVSAVQVAESNCRDAILFTHLNRLVGQKRRVGDPQQVVRLFTLIFPPEVRAENRQLLPARLLLEDSPGRALRIVRRVAEIYESALYEVKFVFLNR